MSGIDTFVTRQALHRTASVRNLGSDENGALLTISHLAQPRVPPLMAGKYTVTARSLRVGSAWTINATVAPLGLARCTRGDLLREDKARVP